MSEKVRLIIWDLDETFWHGTLTEGGITIRPEVCALVKTLASRGIMSSICSKNTLADVQAVLEREGMWEFFIFPSVNWEPKGPRVAALVEAVQLRPASVMFIDDNPLNLEEVRHFVPEIQLQSHEYIPEIMNSPLFVGKDDRALTRLAQYKLLETRKADEQKAGTDVAAFLRTSNIRVEFERDVEANVDRVVEIINRTNQLNFTKTRLSEDPVKAREEALLLLGRYNTQAALLRVSDRYGDHGFTGLYIMNSEHNVLLHFAFSCRILGMGVEQWLYNLLGRPRLEVRGEVLSDPKDTSRTIDWINQDASSIGGQDVARLSVDKIEAHGGCDLSAVGHYFGVHGVDIVPEYNVMREGMSLRLDHSAFLRYASQGLSDAQLAAAEKLLYVPEDFTSAMFAEDGKRRSVLLSFATDGHYGLYRHRETGLVVPCHLGLGPVSTDQREQELPPQAANGLPGRLQKVLREEFDFCGLTTEEDFKATLRATFERIPASVKVFVIRPCDYHLDRSNGQHIPAKSFVDVNRWTKDVANTFSHVVLLDIPDYVKNVSEIENILHYDRKVYFRIYEKIASMLRESGAEARDSRSQVAVPVH